MFKTNFVRLCKEKGISPTRAVLEMGFSRGTISYWDDTVIPKRETLNKIVEYLGCTIEDLLRETPNEKPQHDVNESSDVSDIFEELKKDPAKRLLFSAMQGATPNEIKQAAIILETLKKTRENN